MQLKLLSVPVKNIAASEAEMNAFLRAHRVQLAHALRLFSNHTYGVLGTKRDVVGRMIGGWLKAVSATAATASNHKELAPARQRPGLCQSLGALPPVAGPSKAPEDWRSPKPDGLSERRVPAET